MAKPVENRRWRKIVVVLSHLVTQKLRVVDSQAERGPLVMVGLDTPARSSRATRPTKKAPGYSTNEEGSRYARSFLAGYSTNEEGAGYSTTKTPRGGPTGPPLGLPLGSTSRGRSG
jgi:hypothetical protein